jgi:hypothetical protein
MALFGLIRNKTKSDTPTLPVMRELPPPPQEVDAAPVAATPSEDPLLPTSDELLQMLFSAIVDHDEPRLAALCNDYHDFVMEYSNTWLIPPDSFRDNPAAAEWYSHGIQQIIRTCTPPSDAEALADFLASISGSQ